MPRDIFDQVIEEKRDIFDRVLEDSGQESLLKKQAGEALEFGTRGFAEGLATPGSLLDVVGAQIKEPFLPSQKARVEREALEPADRPSFASMLGDDDVVSPEFSRIASGRDVESAFRSAGFKDKPETMSGRAGRRIGRAAGAAASFGGTGTGLLTRAAATGAGAEELTGSELVGDITELVSTFQPGKLFTKRIPKSVGIEKGRGFIPKDLVSVGRKYGMTESEVGILTQNPMRTKALLRLGHKGRKTEALANSIDAKLGSAYEAISNKSSKLPNVSSEDKLLLISKTKKALKNLSTTVHPSEEKKKAIDYLSSSIEKLGSEDVNPEKLINWWQDINRTINWKVVGGDKASTIMKKPIIQVLEGIDPTLSQDFESINSLYANFKNISDSLRPDTIDKIIKLGEVGTLLGSLYTLNPAVYGSVFLGISGRNAMTSMATNPRYMNILKKGAEALADQKTEKTLQIGRKLTEMIIKDFGEEAVDEELLKKMFFNQSTQATKQQ